MSDIPEKASIGAGEPEEGHAERVHHRNSPSTLQATEACPGYKSEQGTTNEAAETGTMLHEAADGGPSDHLSDEQMDKVNACKQYVQDIVDGYKEAFPGCGVRTITKVTQENGQIVFDMTETEPQRIAGPELFVYVLREVYLGVDDKDTSHGYLDVGIIAPDMLSGHVIDFKFGQNPVETASNNLQGIAYFLGLFKIFYNVKKFTVHFLMPYQAVNVDKHTFTDDSFPRLLLRIQTVVARARLVASYFNAAGIFVGPPEVGALLNPTEGTCLFCARKAGCPKLASHTLAVGHKYDPLIVPASLNAAVITSAEAGPALKFLATIEAASKAIRARLTERATNEENFMPEGYQLVLMERREIVDKRKFYDTIVPLLTPEELIEATSFTFGAVEKAVGAKAPRGSKTAALEDLKNLLQMNGATVVNEPIAILKQKKVPAKSATPAIN